MRVRISSSNISTDKIMMMADWFAKQNNTVIVNTYTVAVECTAPRYAKLLKEVCSESYGSRNWSLSIHIKASADIVAEFILKFSGQELVIHED